MALGSSIGIKYKESSPSKLSKFIDKTLACSIQNTATDFAYSDRKYFTRRSWNTHLNTFIFGAINGAIQYGSKQLFSERWIGYGMDILQTQLIILILILMLILEHIHHIGI